jgi:hypothetical protein
MRAYSYVVEKCSDTGMTLATCRDFQVLTVRVELSMNFESTCKKSLRCGWKTANRSWKLSS